MATRRHRIRRAALWGAVALAAAGAAALALRPAAAKVDLGAVDRGPLQVTLDEDGKTRVRQRALVAAPVAGNLLRPEVAPGDAVEEGQVLARLEPLQAPLLDAAGRAELGAAERAAQAGVEQALAATERARAAEQAAAEQLARQRALVAGGSAPRATLEDASALAHAAAHEAAAAAFGARVAQHQLELARASSKRALGGGGGPALELRSPITGVVLSVHQELGGPVQVGTPLLEVGDTTALEVVVPVLSADAVALPPRARALLGGWGGGELEGHVRAVEPRGFTRVSALGVEEQRVPVIVDVDTADGAARRLGDGYRVQARLVRWESPEVLRAPAGALFRQGDGWAAFVFEDGRARTRAVTVGHRAGALVEVLAGLEAGERVVLYPTERISDGQRVVPR